MGGIELGLEWTGKFRTIWHSEIEPYPSAILEERWKGVPNLGDITKIRWEKVERPDILCGGFPCQDISTAGRREGIQPGNRSGLWYEFLKAIRSLRPKYVIIENVSAIAIRGLDIVLGDLASSGLDAEWIDLRASDFGAPHKRERIFIVAYQRGAEHPDTDGHGLRRHKGVAISDEGESEQRRKPDSLRNDVSNTDDGRLRVRGSVEDVSEDLRDRRGSVGDVGEQEKSVELLPDTNELRLERSRSEQQTTRTPRSSEELSDTNSVGRRGRSEQRHSARERDFQPEEQSRGSLGSKASGRSSSLPDSDSNGVEKRISDELLRFQADRSGNDGHLESERGEIRRHEGWSVEPNVDRVVDGITKGLDSYLWRERIKALGNGVVPQVYEWVGRRILYRETFEEVIK